MESNIVWLTVKTFKKADTSLYSDPNLLSKPCGISTISYNKQARHHLCGQLDLSADALSS